MRERISSVVAVAGLFTVLLAPWARATVSEQRARLPPPAECTDPVAGVWKSHKYRQQYEQWTEFKLYVHREPGSPNGLRGTIENHSWYGPPDMVQPDTCNDRLRYVVTMDARGKVDGETIEFWGVGKWRLDKVLCGSWNGSYYLDHFTGEIDPDILEFQSVNNDGATAVNEPTVFRRVKCHQTEPLPEDLEVPDFEPPTGGLGCSWF